ncbi:MAG: CrcB family protein [Armatimonadetes bacterium]|nr:CrcB family protein [Armatimonadota bacterium]
MLQKIVWLAFAGACGTISRYALYEITAKAKIGQLPLGTFAVNVLGSFLFGLLYSLAQRKLNISGEMRMVMLVGFMGAFTTFSALAFETAQMLKSAQWLLAFGNVFGQTALGIAALVAGVLIGRGG